MEYEIIDFHTHPFATEEYNICAHKSAVPMSRESTLETMKALGISRFCGSVIRIGKDQRNFETVRAWNDQALSLAEYYGGAYIPGFHVHPSFVRESCEEIERMSRLGVRLIGELVPYGCFSDWDCDYSSPAFSEILDCAEQYHMVVSFHSMWEDAMDKMVAAHPGVVFVAAHPGEYTEFKRHMERMKTSKNYYLDVSGYGIFRHGMLRHAIDLFGAERFLFGSDYPTCTPAMYLGGVVMDPLIREDEKRLILSENAKRLLRI